MATIKIKLHKGKTLANGEHPIVLQIIKDRKRKVIYTNKSCKEKLWDEKEGIVTKQHPNRYDFNSYLAAKKSEATSLLLSLETEKKDGYSLEEFERKLKNKSRKITVFNFIDSLIEKYLTTGKIGNCKVYKDTKRELMNFRKKKDFEFSDINQLFLSKFETHFRLREIKENTMSVYFRTLRSIYNKAIEEGYVKKSDYPFNVFKVSKFDTTTQKRAIKKEELKAFINYQPNVNSTEFHSHNYFLFSFYLMGMNFVDMAYLKWEQIDSERLRYKRAKNGKNFDIKILPPAQSILDYYKSVRSTNYVFPILNDLVHVSPTTKDNRIKKVLKTTNSDLKIIGKAIGISTPLTTYVARHGWAMYMKLQGTAIAVISEGMGHDSEDTTQTYLDSFGNEILDNANETLLKI